MQNFKSSYINIFIYLVIISVTIWIFYIIIFGNGGIIERKRIMTQIGNLEREIDNLKEEKLRLEWEIHNLKVSDDYLIRLAHSYGYKQDDEIVFKFLTKKTVK